ncbi:hypothetical protein AMJ86_02475 [bacterium SM23_57]|nr:MAG: hypothetical protein AMJ86_02475 [bacterium SM23_57]
MLNFDLIRIGTSSFSEKDWVGPFYPEGTNTSDFIKLYSQRYTTVEIDSTYYAIPGQRTIDNWVSKTPDDFLFTAKFPRSIVHGGDGPQPDPKVILNPDKTYPDRDRFLEVMSGLGPRLGPYVIQFPYFNKKVFPSKYEFFDRLNAFLDDLPINYRYAVEIRNKWWLTEEFTLILRRYNVALVLVDQAWMPHGDEVMRKLDPVTSDFVYIRLLGDRKEIEAITENWDKEVIDRGDRLERWVKLIAKFTAQEIPTLTYANNHYAGHAPSTVDRLQKLLQDIAEAYKTD